MANQIVLESALERGRTRVQLHTRVQPMTKRALGMVAIERQIPQSELVDQALAAFLFPLFLREEDLERTNVER
jgi:hypothetical protein